MSSPDRRSAGRRRAWGRGPIILKFESLERRELLSSASPPLPDLVGSSFVTTPNADWNQSITASGTVTNQGAATVTTPFNVAIYASHGVTIGPYSVLLGEVTIPAGLAPGQSAPFTTTVKLPSSPLPGMSINGIVHINMKIDPQHVVPESNTRNQSGLGPGYDEAGVQITPPQPANLVNTSMHIYPSAPEWGGSVTVTAQVSNEAYGAAPATREAVVLTPSGPGIAPGTGSDVVIGSISVPPIPAWSMVNVEGTINLPMTPPELLTNDSEFTLWVEPDADYVTNPVYPHLPSGNQGVDEQTVSITVPPGTTPPALGPLPDLAAGAVTTSASTLYWGQSFSTQAVVQNLGAANPGPFVVRFILVGASGSTSSGLFLGDTTVAGLAPGATTVVNQTLTLPLRLPASVTLSSVGVGRIVEIVDPEDVINEAFYNNNTAESGPVTLRLLGTDGSSYVPNLPNPAQLLPVRAPVVPAKARKPIIVKERSGAKRLFKRPPPKQSSLLHTLTVFPTQVNNLIKKFV
ncbi:MAG: CARDB domain-containing protein [Isosphaeraceae bacterium]